MLTDQFGAHIGGKVTQRALRSSTDPNSVLFSNLDDQGRTYRRHEVRPLLSRHSGGADYRKHTQ